MLAVCGLGGVARKFGGWGSPVALSRNPLDALRLARLGRRRGRALLLSVAEDLRTTTSQKYAAVPRRARI